MSMRQILHITSSMHVKVSNSVMILTLIFKRKHMYLTYS